MKHLFEQGLFHLHGGDYADFKIECDALTDADIDTIALLLSRILEPFGSVDGVPLGGLRLSRVMREYATEGPLLIVDDVLTTGGSMEALRAGREVLGAVIFARHTPLPWITPLFQMSS